MLAAREAERLAREAAQAAKAKAALEAKQAKEKVRSPRCTGPNSINCSHVN